jgi:hypothetical protein
VQAVVDTTHTIAAVTIMSESTTTDGSATTDIENLDSAAEMQTEVHNGQMKPLPVLFSLKHH